MFHHTQLKCGESFNTASNAISRVNYKVSERSFHPSVVRVLLPYFYSGSFINFTYYFVALLFLCMFLFSESSKKHLNLRSSLLSLKLKCRALSMLGKCSPLSTSLQLVYIKIFKIVQLDSVFKEFQHANVCW